MIAALLQAHSAERPDTPALTARTGSWTWGELQTQVDRLAAGLFARGLRSGDAAVILLANEPAFVAAFLAVARIGAVAVPLAVDLKPDEIRRCLANSGARTVIAADRFSPLCRALIREGVVSLAVLGTGTDGLPGLDEIAAETHAPPPCPIPHAAADALMQFTSGTTGPPKPVVKTHGQLLHGARAVAEALAVTRADRILAVVPLSHGHGLCSGLLAFLTAGAVLTLQEKFDRRQTLSLLADERITVFPAVPFLCSVLADTQTAEPVDLSALRVWVTGGSPLTAAIRTKVHERFGRRPAQIYGSTEAGPMTIDFGDDADAAPGSVGRPLPGVRIAALDDSESANSGGMAGGTPPAMLTDGTEGELSVQSPAAARWSHGPTGRVPLGDAYGSIRTGDRGRLDGQGRVTLTGRGNDIVNVAGRKVNPAELEVLLAGHPAIRDAAVVGVRDAFGEEAVKAVLVADVACTREEILAWCRERMADFKLPRIVEFRESLPRAANGKLRRSDLR